MRLFSAEDELRGGTVDNGTCSIARALSTGKGEGADSESGQSSKPELLLGI